MMPTPKLLNVGGGSKSIAIPKHYVGFEHLLLDIDPSGEPDIVKDARLLRELEPQQFDAIYCSHNLEHYRAHEVPKVLAGFAHVLTNDGMVEICVPDLDMVMRAYVEKNLDLDGVLYTASVGEIAVRDVLYGWGKQIEKTGQDFYAHRTGFTETTMVRHLSAAGFNHVIRRPGRAFELHVVAFRVAPTEAQRQLLKIRYTAAR